MKTIQDHIQLIRNLENPTLLQEGAIGTAIGSGLGALAGSLVGPLGTVAGAATGGWLGNKIGDAVSHIFDPSSRDSKAVNSNDIQADQGGSQFMTTNPDGSVSAVTAPPDGKWGPNNGQTYDKTTGEFTDKYGNQAKDYVTQSDTVAISASYSGKPASGELKDEIQKIENARGTGLNEVASWSWKNSILVLLESDRSRKQKSNGDTETGVWNDITNMATMGGGDAFVGLYKRLGYTDFAGDNVFRTKGPLGNLLGEHHVMKRKGTSISLVNMCQFFTFQSAKGKGLHIYQVGFIGPTDEFNSGGKEELQALSNSVKLSSSVKPLSPPSVKEQIQRLQNHLNSID
jgi:hypothetical protein